MGLKEAFERNPYPSKEEFVSISESLDMKNKSVRVCRAIRLSMGLKFVLKYKCIYISSQGILTSLNQKKILVVVGDRGSLLA